MLSSAVIPAPPTLQHDLHASETGVTWLLTGFLLSASVGTAIIGKLGDMYGKQRRRGRSAVRRERDHLLEGCSARFCHQRGGAASGAPVHAAACTTTGLPLAWRVQTAKDSEIPMVPVLVDIIHTREFTPGILVMDRGYDTEALYTTVESKGIRPVIPPRKTPAVKAGKHLPPECPHGMWTYAGSDAKRGASKWRCPPASASPRPCGSRHPGCTP